MRFAPARRNLGDLASEAGSHEVGRLAGTGVIERADAHDVEPLPRGEAAQQLRRSLGAGVGRGGGQRILFATGRSADGAAAVLICGTDQEDARYAQVVVADLNGDGKNELLLREVKDHQIEVLYRSPDGEWKSGMRFEVFEGRSFQMRAVESGEPREIVAAELTGDGLIDMAIIVHDRVIVYPQQGPAGAE